MVLSEHCDVANRFRKLRPRVVGEHGETILESYQERDGVDDAVGHISDDLHVESCIDEAIQKLLHCYFRRWRQCYSRIIFFLFLLRLFLLRLIIKVIVIEIIEVVRVKIIEVEVVWI